MPTPDSSKIMFRLQRVLAVIGTRPKLTQTSLPSRTTTTASTHVDPGKQEEVIVPKDLALSEYIFQNADKISNKTALIDGQTGVKIGFDQLREEIRILSSAFHRLGVRHRDVVTLYGTNTPHVVHVLCSVTDNGAALSLASPQLTADELASQLRQTRSRYVIATPDCAKTAIRATFLSPYTQEVITTGEVTGCRSLSSLLEKKDLPPYPRVHINPDSTTAVIPFSSGTTGTPKGVMLSHTNIIADICQLRHPRFLGMQADSDLSLCSLPTVHMAGLTIALCLPLSQGVPVVTQSHFNQKNFLKALQEYRATFALLAPPIVHFLAKHPMVAQYDLSSLETPYCGASSLSASLTQMFIDRLKLPGIRQGYGLTETSPATHTSPRDGWKHGSIGVPLPLTRCKVVDPDTGASLGPGQEGEVCVRGPQVMRGYINNPEATQKAFTANGWLKTGDLGYYDEDGHYFIVDRLKDIIKYNGYQISPAHLESILLGHPAVSEAAVVGIPADEAGEIPRAFVVTNTSVTEKNLEDYVADRVASYRRLRGGVEFVKEVPKIPSGKMLRRVIRDNYISRHKSKSVGEL